MGNSTISMAIFHSFLYVHQRVVVPCFWGFPEARQVLQLAKDQGQTVGEVGGKLMSYDKKTPVARKKTDRIPSRNIPTYP